MLCTKCGKELPDDSKFCAFCGATIGGESRPLAGKKLSNVPAGAPAKKSTDKKAPPTWAGCLILIVVVAIIGGIIGVCLGGEDTTKELNASVYVREEVQLEIHNNDSFDWTDVTLTLNDTYTLTEDRLEAGSTYTVGLAQFTRKDGTRFNPFTQKAQQITIFCDEGYYGGER